MNATPTSPRAPLRILVADDSQAVRRVVCELLDAHDPTWLVCGEASDGQDALKKAEELKPDVVLLDLSIPKLSGLETAKLLQAEHPACAVVLMSAQEPLLLQRIAAAASVTHSVSKSNLCDALIPTLESIFHQRPGASFPSA